MNSCGARALSPLVYKENTLTSATAIRHRAALFCSLYWRNGYQLVLVAAVNRPRAGGIAYYLALPRNVEFLW
jgi:hypothetical protein